MEKGRSQQTTIVRPQRLNAAARPQPMITLATPQDPQPDRSSPSIRSRHPPLATNSPRQNHLLAALPDAVLQRLLPSLEFFPLTPGAILNEPGVQTHHVYFPTDSVVSQQYMMTDGASSGVALIGNEGLTGVDVFLGGGACCFSVVQSGGGAFRLESQRLRDEFNRHGELLLLLLRYAQAMMAHVAQTAACNRHHSVDQQFCRWLLLSLDRLPGNKLKITQELIANTLGVRRQSVTDAACKLQREGIIRYCRGNIAVLDRARLRQLSCECYQMMKQQTDRVLSAGFAGSPLIPACAKPNVH